MQTPIFVNGNLFYFMCCRRFAKVFTRTRRWAGRLSLNPRERVGRQRESRRARQYDLQRWAALSSHWVRRQTCGPTRCRASEWLSSSPRLAAGLRGTRAQWVWWEWSSPVSDSVSVTATQADAESPVRPQEVTMRHTYRHRCECTRAPPNSDPQKAQSLRRSQSALHSRCTRTPGRPEIPEDQHTWVAHCKVGIFLVLQHSKRSLWASLQATGSRCGTVTPAATIGVAPIGPGGPGPPVFFYMKA